MLQRYLFLLLLTGLVIVAGFHDSIFDYVSFQDSQEWQVSYDRACSGSGSDPFREPRRVTKSNDLKAPQEAKSPVSINTSDVIRSTEPATLHIFNNFGVRSGYSVSYGFQRNKECIHGQDSDCVVNYSFGSVRALVVNAERFERGQNLNYIKDRFLIEDPEKFVTILNGGSVFERKFYEAVFLGGYFPPSRSDIQGHDGRSSHRIDGKGYPLEIYMFFVDETVPSISLSTILVVLVEESEKDNPYVKPIVAAVKDKLYDQERRYIHNHQLLARREKLFHHLDLSAHYDLNEIDQRRRTNRNTNKKIIGETIRPSHDNEDIFSTLAEVYEKMQALESEIYFLNEDLEELNLKVEGSSKEIESFIFRQVIDQFPYLASDEYLYWAFITHEIHKAVLEKQFDFTAPGEPSRYCKEQARGQYQRKNGSAGGFEYTKRNTLWEKYETARDSNRENVGVKKIPENIRKWVVHFHQDYDVVQLQNFPTNSQNLSTFKKLYENQADYASRGENFYRLLDAHRNETDDFSEDYCNLLMKIIAWEEENRKSEKNLTRQDKWRRVFLRKALQEDFEQFNVRAENHFFRTGSFHQREPDLFLPKFASEIQRKKSMSPLLELIYTHYKHVDYTNVRSHYEKKIQEIVEENNFGTVANMKDVIHYHKFGFKNFNLRARRDYVHDAFLNHFLPNEQKRGAFKEYGNMEQSQEEIVETSKITPLKVKVDQSFQISWLMPPNGGYFHYAGSSPLPPCFRAQNVIVFKKPITMSRNQIEVLTRIPRSFDRKDDIVVTTPVMKSLKFQVHLRGAVGDHRGRRKADVIVPVYDEPRNHLFLGHDGVQKNSVEESEKRDRNNTEGSSSHLKPNHFGYRQTILIILLIIFWAS